MIKALDDGWDKMGQNTILSRRVGGTKWGWDIILRIMSQTPPYFVPANGKAGGLSWDKIEKGQNSILSHLP